MHNQLAQESQRRLFHSREEEKLGNYNLAELYLDQAIVLEKLAQVISPVRSGYVLTDCIMGKISEWNECEKRYIERQKK